MRKIVSGITMLFAGMWFCVGLQHGFWAMDLDQPVWGMAMIGQAIMWGIVGIGAIVVYNHD